MPRQRIAPTRNQVSRPKRRRLYKHHILIVTEGGKTEPFYFEDLRNTEKIESIKVKVIQSEYGTNTLNVVDFAIDMKFKNIRENKREGEPRYDKIYCVVDRDSHEYFQEAFIKARANRIRLIRSIPCFEIWYLLHFMYSTKSYIDREELKREVAKKLGGYEKRDRLYNVLRDRLESAIENADKLLKYQSGLCDTNEEHPNPLTEVHTLVKNLLYQNFD